MMHTLLFTSNERVKNIWVPVLLIFYICSNQILMFKQDKKIVFYESAGKQMRNGGWN